LRAVHVVFKWKNAAAGGRGKRNVFAVSRFKHCRQRLGMIVRLLFLLMLANGTPLLANKILGDRFSHPLDGGARCPDEQPVFGASKTIRGILLSVLVTAIAGRLVGLGYKIGARVGSGAMAGDLFSSFLKRRMRLPASSRAVGLDQVPESLFPLLACRGILSLTVLDVAVCVLAFFLSEVLISRLLYKFRVRDRPY
jgi:CDP-2,3-bis-(O-geranylgeranyl)-sn-glycerol synthase